MPGRVQFSWEGFSEQFMRTCTDVLFFSFDNKGGTSDQNNDKTGKKPARFT